MAFPQVASVTETTFPSTSSTSHNTDMPATANTGDLLLMLFACEGTPNTSNLNPTPSGWTLIDTYANVSWTVHLLARVSDGTEGGTQVNVITNGTLYASAQVYRITGFAGTISTDIDASADDTASSDPASLTADWGSDDNLWLSWIAWSQTIARTPTSPTNFGTAVHTSVGTTAAMAQLASATDENATATYNPSAWSFSGGVSSQFNGMVVIKPSTATTVSSVGAIATAEAVPSPVLKSGISLSGIASEEAFGTATMRMNVTAEAIASAEAVGEPTVSPIQAVSPTGIVTEEAVGTPAVAPDTYTITPDGIASAEAIGDAVIGRAVFPSSISSLEAFGTAHIKKYVTFNGIASAEAIGSHQLNRSLILTGIASTEAFGTTVIQVGSVTITVSGISTEEDVPDGLTVVAATTSGFRRPPPGSARYAPTPSAGSARYAVRPPAGV